MPAYMSTEFIFLRSKLTETTIRDFYGAIQVNGIKFDKVFAWGCSEELSLGEIIQWNQEKLDSGFELGTAEDVSNDYRQILLAGTPYAVCRVIVFNSMESDDEDIYTDTFSFCIIVPHSDIYEHGDKWLKEIAESVWARMPVSLIRTYGEIDDGPNYDEVQKGELVNTRLFSYILDEHFSDEYERKYISKQVSRGYFFEGQNSD